MFHLQLAIRHCLLDVGQPLLQTGPEDETPTADQLRRRFYLSHRNFRSAVALVWVAVAVRHWILAGLFLRCFGMERLEWSMFQRLFPVFRRVAGVRIGLISILHSAAVPVPAERPSSRLTCSESVLRIASGLLHAGPAPREACPVGLPGRSTMQRGTDRPWPSGQEVL